MEMQNDAGQNVAAVEPTAASPSGKGERLAAWLQFPRRVVLLLIGFVLATVLLTVLPRLIPTTPLPAGRALPPELEQRLEQRSGLWWEGTSFTTRGPVTEAIGERLPNTLLLLGTAMTLALLVALTLPLVAALVHWLEQGKAGPLGSVLKGLGRLMAFGRATSPAFVFGLLLILVFAVRLDLLPAVGMFDPAGDRGLADRLLHLILPALTLTCPAGVLTAQSVAREVTLARQRRGVRLWLAALFRALGTLLGQIGGLLGTAILVEAVFAWPGIGRVMVEAAYRQDYPLLLGAVGTCTVLVLVGRLAAELFRWLERLVSVPTLVPQPEPTRWRKIARRVWVVAALLLLLLPLGLAIAGLVTGSDAALQVDMAAQNQPPSAEHPWGADLLGRDVQARTLRGGMATLGLAVAVAAIILFPGGVCGALLGFLFSRRTWWAESIADLLLLPADVLLFVPAVPAAVLTLAMARMSVSDWPSVWAVIVGAVAAIVVLARLVRVFPALWLAAPERRRWLTLGLAGSGALFLGGLFAAVWLLSAADFLGVGAPFPVPTLGNMLNEAFQWLTVTPHTFFAPGIALWLCTFALYTAADALAGFFHTKEALVRLNE